VLTQLNDPERLQRAAARIRRMFERHIKFNPDDLYARSCYVIVLDHSGDRARAREVAEQLSTEERLPPISLFNLAAIYLYDHDYERAMTIIKRSIERGLRDLEALKYYEENNIPGTDEVVALMKQKIAEDAAQG
jgi:Flp pilus assembly protein TadD